MRLQPFVDICRRFSVVLGRLDSYGTQVFDSKQHYVKGVGGEARTNGSISQHFVTFPNGNQRYEIVGGRSGRR